MKLLEKCPNCGSRSGVDVKSRPICHACKKDFQPKKKSLLDILHRSKELIEGVIVDLNKKPSLELPEYDTNYQLPRGHVWNYLEAYHYTYQQCSRNNIFWSEKYNRLCFPYFRDNEMIGCWMRDTTGQSDRKWMYAGIPKAEYVWLCHDDTFPWKITPVVCIVEDVISSIRVSKFMDCVCLGGTSWNSAILLPLLLNYKSVIVFLDNDKAGKTASTKFRKEFSLIREIKVIRAEKDPKCLTNTELEELLK